MKWFKHISDSLDDPFIFDLIENFGHTGYVVFFGTIEMYAREFEPDSDWFLSVSLRLLANKLQISHMKRLQKVLNFIQKTGKWTVKYEGKKVSIFIPKFFNFLDETTLKKLREKRESGRNKSGTVPEQFLPIDADADVYKDNSKELSGKQPSEPPPKRPKKKPAAQAPPASKSKHFSVKVGDQLEKIERHCRDIEKRCKENGKIFNPWQWVTQKTNIRGHPLAISQSLEFLLLQWDEVENPWGFADKTFKTKNPKFNEQQELSDSQAFKADKQTASKEFQDLWAKAMRRFGGNEKGG